MQVTTRTLHDLGYEEILSALAHRCRTAPGKERSLARPFLDGPEQISAALQLVDEARLLAQEQFSLPLGGVSDLRNALGQAEKGGLLEPRELIAAAQLLFAFARTREALEEREARVPALTTIARRLPLLEPLARRIDRCFTPDGEISDDASPDLRAARDRARGLHGTIKTRLDALLHDQNFLPNLREPYYSIRNGRYVVPVVSSFQAQVPGIVHNASQTGQTLFVEPQVMVGLGNELAIAQSVVFEEERRVLQELTNLLGREAAKVEAGIEAVAELDAAEAAGILAADLRAWSPRFEGVTQLGLRNLRHPLLVLKGDEVVPNDVTLEGEAHALVISGPNAGGKTVTLTAVGLSALMLRAGLPVPASEGSSMPLYTSVHSTIGDAQDLSQGLSTFSAHLVQLRNIAQSVGPGSLVLVDEIAADTDPREGAAIAIAVLEEFLDRGATTLVTTHLEELKALAHMDRRFLNARVGFDPRKMAPTYKLQLGAAGASSAIDVASRMGLPEKIVKRARELTVSSGGPLAQAIAAAELERQKLSDELEKAKRTSAEAEELRRQLDEAKQQFARERKAQEMAHQQALHAQSQKAADEIAEVLKSIRLQKDEKATSEARLKLQQQADEARKKAEAAKAELFKVEAPAPAQLEVGKVVHHSGFGRDVEILELAGEHAVVAAGPLKMRVPVSELSGARKAKQEPKKFPDRHKGAAAIKRAEEVAPQEFKAPNYRVDVRGMRADDALAEVEGFLDRGMRGGEDAAVIIHGHGTGALKQAIRDYLDASPYIRMYRPGANHEGGDGVTVVSLRA